MNNGKFNSNQPLSSLLVRVQGIYLCLYEEETCWTWMIALSEISSVDNWSTMKSGSPMLRTHVNFYCPGYRQDYLFFISRYMPLHDCIAGLLFSISNCS